MKLQELPVEVQLQILEYLEPEQVLHHVSLLNSHFSELCRTPQLWRRIVPPEYRYARGVDREPHDLRQWFIQADSAASQATERLYEFAKTPSPELALEIVEHGPVVVPYLQNCVKDPPSLRHVFWSRWFIAAISILEGVKLAKSDTTDPLILAMVASMLTGKYYLPSVLAILNSPVLPRLTTWEPAERLQALLPLIDSFHQDSLFKCCLFHRIATDHNLFHTSLFSLGTTSSAYCGVLDFEPPSFVDFSGETARVRSAEDIRDRMALLGVTTIQPGLDRSQILADFPSLVEGNDAAAFQELAKTIQLPAKHSYLIYCLDKTYGTSLYLPDEKAVEYDDMTGRLCGIKGLDELGIVLCRAKGDYRVLLPSRIATVPAKSVASVTCTIPLSTEFDWEMPKTGHELVAGAYFGRYDKETQRFFE